MSQFLDDEFANLSFDELIILGNLHDIGEEDPVIIRAVLKDCRTNLQAKAFFMNPNSLIPIDNG